MEIPSVVLEVVVQAFSSFLLRFVTQRVRQYKYGKNTETKSEGWWVDGDCSHGLKAELPRTHYASLTKEGSTHCTKLPENHNFLSDIHQSQSFGCSPRQWQKVSGNLSGSIRHILAFGFHCVSYWHQSLESCRTKEQTPSALHWNNLEQAESSISFFCSNFKHSKNNQ